MKPLVDSLQFFNSAILAKYSIVSLRRRSVDYTPNLHCTQNAGHCIMLHKRTFVRTKTPKN